MRDVNSPDFISFCVSRPSNLEKVSLEAVCEVSAMKLIDTNVTVVNIYHRPTGQFDLFIGVKNNLLRN